MSGYPHGRTEEVASPFSSKRVAINKMAYQMKEEASISNGLTVS